MPRFYLNPIIGGRLARDHDGEEHPSLEAARTSAVLGGREILTDQLRGEEISFQGVAIADESGVILQVVGISEILRGHS
ncbi:MAG: hypothetical protein JWL62_3845 [Hyphomicrobiales bacterium]|nr:hypothetical protein [Hyphomicrobiales bacterium]